MTNREILQIAMRQSAIDINCVPEDFNKKENVVVRAELKKGVRSYYKEPIACNLVSYGGNVVASVKDEYRDFIADYIGKYEWYRCFETPQINELTAYFDAFGFEPKYMAEYRLPDMDARRLYDCGYPLKVLTKSDFSGLYLPQWSNALCADRSEYDVLCVGAYDGEKLIGLAGCSADCDTMWQIGVDVLPQYRRRGIAAAVTSRLAAEALNRGKVPYYCSAWSNIISKRNAEKCGFKNAWTELTVKPKEKQETE